jgi:serine/threonine-protein kinase
MEFVDGSDLKGVIEHRKKLNQPFPLEEACLICVRICEGLAYAHELVDGKGHNLHIVHRDMSPPNVLITRFGEVKIVDFGLAKANSQLEKSEPGIIKGKFSYLSPEVAQGLPVDGRTDIFAVGIMLWEMLAGRRLFLGDSDLETVRLVQKAEIPPIRQFNPKVTADLEKVVLKGLAADPAKRYQSARDFGRDLNKMLFHLGRAVSSFDISQLVLPIWRERQQKKRDKVDKGSMIGSLIDEALFEFTSLDGQGGGGEKSTVGAVPVSIGSFEDVHNWVDDISGGDTSGVERHGPMSYELGNLAALEDDDPRPLPARPGTPQPMHAQPMPAQIPTPSGARPAASAPRTPATDDEPSPAKGGGKGGLVGILLLVVAAAAAAGAYFGGLIHK